MTTTTITPGDLANIPHPAGAVEVYEWENLSGTELARVTADTVRWFAGTERFVRRSDTHDISGLNPTVADPSAFFCMSGRVVSTPASFWSVSRRERVWLSYTVNDQNWPAGTGPGNVMLNVLPPSRY